MRGVDVSLDQIERLPGLMHPADYSVSSRSALRSGHALWEGEIAGRHVGIAWGWTEMATRVVALMDPMKLLSNMRILGPHGGYLDANLQLVYLNTVVFSLAWQIHLQDATLH
jgi:hypothetical protein